MKKPEALVQLLEELKGEAFVTSVEASKESKAVIYLDDDSAEREDGIQLSKEDCELLLHNPTTIDRLLESLGEPTGASLTLFAVEPALVVLDAIERRFVAVDEG
jgi:hypothetical protein